MAFQTSMNAMFVVFYPQLGIFIFGVSHLIASSLFTAVFYSHIIPRLGRDKLGLYPVNGVRDLLPSNTTPLFPERLKPLVLSFTWQSFLKQILTEGEKFIMSGFQLLTFAEQGIYDVVNNLGSLVARLIFQQVEENAYVLFSKLLNRETGVQKSFTVSWWLFWTVIPFRKSHFANMPNEISWSFVLLVCGRTVSFCMKVADPYRLRASSIFSSNIQDRPDQLWK